MQGFSYRGQELFCEDVAVNAICDQVGSPVYIYSRLALLEKFRSIRDAFNAEADTTVCFSVKNCSNINILRELAKEGSGFDIVSGGELYRVMQAGGDPAKVAFAGVGKTDAEIRYALECGIMLFNVESEEELVNINRLAGQMKKIAPVALRINPDVDAKTHAKTTTGKKENKFGIEFAYAMQLVSRMSKFPHVVLKGIDVHLGSPINSTEPYAEGMDKVMAFLSTCPKTVEYVDAGGGFGLLYNKEHVPEFKAYAKVIGAPVKAAGKKLVIEPGRSVTGNSAILVGEVQYVKSSGTKTFYMIDAGMNDLIRPAMYDAFHFIWPVKNEVLPESKLFPEVEGGGLTIPADVVGPICESSDVFCKDRALPEMTRGDRVAIFSAGAYGFSMSSNYNSRPRPAEVLVDGKHWSIIRRREDWKDLVAAEQPE